MSTNDQIAKLITALDKSTDKVSSLTKKLTATLLALEEKKKELAALQKEYDRLHEEITQPRCHSCNAELGDNWCADCARKATL